MRHRLNDPRAYDVGLSDDAGGGNPLGFATKVTYAPNQKEVATLDEYIGSTLFGIKDKAGDGAKPPYKSLQVGGYAGFECGNRTNPHDLTCEGIRMTMFYYNQSYFDWKYTEERGCGMVLDNWCMTEAYANATYRVFNYPHHIASYYGMYRVARNHDKMKTEQSWEFYLERAALTVLRMGSNNIGFMDGTIQREVLRSVQEEDAAAGADSTWGTLAAMILKNQQSRAKYWSTAKYVACMRAHHILLLELLSTIRLCFFFSSLFFLILSFVGGRERGRARVRVREGPTHVTCFCAKQCVRCVVLMISTLFTSFLSCNM